MKFRSGLTAVLLLFISVALVALTPFELLSKTLIVCLGTATVCGMFFSLATMETAKRKLSRHWELVLAGTTWRTAAGETVTAIGADNTGTKITVKFSDGYVNTFWTRELEIVTKGISFKTDDFISDGDKLLAATGKRRWRTEDGRVGIVRNYEFHHAADSGSISKYLVLRLNDGNTETFNLDRLVAI